MATRSLLLCFLAVLCFALASPASAEPRMALVLGNGAYRHAAPLAAPAGDAAAMAAALRNLGFDVLLGTDLTKPETDDLVRRFIGRLPDADMRLLYFAGYGLHIGKLDLLLPVDARLRDWADAAAESIDLGQLVTLMEAWPGTNLVFADAASPNPFATRLTRGGAARRVIGGGLAALAPAPDTVLAYADQPGEVTPAPGSGQHSRFTQALLERLDRPVPDVVQMLIGVRRALEQATEGAQTPWIKANVQRVLALGSPRGPSAEPPDSDDRGEARRIRASFDCGKAETPQELLLCSDRELAALDRELGDVYQQVLEERSGAARDEAVTEQRRWIALRDQLCPMTQSELLDPYKRLRAIDCMHNVLIRRAHTLRSEL
jgi:uncharacterized caspase-like protein